MNFPSGVTGREYAIAGPDYERDATQPCPYCGGVVAVEQGYSGTRWLVCAKCGWATQLYVEQGEDPDDARDRRMERDDA